MAERPLECSHCKKPIKVSYKEISKETIVCTKMCDDCPVLERKLHAEETDGKGVEDPGAGLCCGHCHTSLEAIKMGNPLGCSECYSVFSDLLVGELISRNKIPSRLTQALVTHKSQPIHMGRSPGKSFAFNSASRLVALNEALNEALKKENYEQAAWLRDQIKLLKDKPDEGQT